jgi:hypothetical protein
VSASVANTVQTAVTTAFNAATTVICPLQSGPSNILDWTLKEKTNGQETRA